MKKAKISVGLVMIAAVFFGNSTLSDLDLHKSSAKEIEAVESAKFDFKYTGIVDVGQEIMPLIGQLSKSGNNLYITSQNMRGSKQLYVMNRKAKGENFSKPVRVKGGEHGDNYDILMPTFTADEQTMVFVTSRDNTQKGNDLFIATLNPEKGEFYDIRPLDEVNDPHLADSYPWISPDGSRLYFTKQKGANITFFVAEKNKATGKYNAPAELGFELPKITNNMSCFLSGDEKEIFALSGEKIYHATRKSLKDSFSAPEEIAESSNNGFISGITMTDDKEELFVFNSIGFRNTQIMRFANAAARQPETIQDIEKKGINVR